jgi:hypothetical protein
MVRISSRARAAALSGLLIGFGSLGSAAVPAAARAHHRSKTHRSHTHRRAGHRAVTPAQSAVGDFFSGPFHFRFRAYRAAGAPDTAATGSVTAMLDVGGNALTKVTGPVTCLNIVGREAALFYPIATANPFLFSLLRGVMLYIQVGADGRPQSINYIPFRSSVSSCPPSVPGLLPITSGTVTLRS